MQNEEKQFDLVALKPADDAAFDIDKYADANDKNVKAMEWGNRVLHLPTTRKLTDEQSMQAAGLLPSDSGLPRLKQVPRLWKLGKVVQIVGGAPEGMDFIRPKGVDEVWAINPRLYWPEDKEPDLLLSRDHSYLQGPTADEPTFVRWGTEILKRWPLLPVAVTADLGWWVAERVLHRTFTCPPWLQGRAWYELSLHNLFDTQFASLSGFSVGLALALARHAGAKIVLTGLGGVRSDATYKEQGSRGYKSEQSLRNEDMHINKELAAFCNRYGGKSVWHHGPIRAIGSVAPDWPA
jgi:hypothetical protein